MGVKNLNTLLQRYASQCLLPDPRGLTQFRGRRLAVDGNLVTYKFYYSTEGDEQKILNIWFRFVRNLMEHGITPVCVFDSQERAPVKRLALIRRKATRDLAAKRGVEESKRSKAHQDAIQLLCKLKSYPNVGNVMAKLAEANSIFEQGRPLKPSSLDLSIPSSTNFSLSCSPRLYIFGYILSVFLRVESSVFYPQGLKITNSTHLPSHLVTQAFESFSELPIIEQKSPLYNSCFVRSGLSHRQKTLDYDEDVLVQSLIKNVKSTEDLKNFSIDGFHELEDRTQSLFASFVRESSKLGVELFSKCQALLQAMGVPVIVSELAVEAEAMCAALVKHGLADSVISEDSDVLVHGSSLLRNATNSRASDSITCIRSEDVRKALGDLDQSQWIDLALLCGTDFAETIPKIGPITAQKYIVTYGTIENMLEALHPKYLDKPAARKSYLDDIAEARAVFTTSPSMENLPSLELRVQDTTIVNTLLGRNVMRHDDFDDAPYGFEEKYDM